MNCIIQKITTHKLTWLIILMVMVMVFNTPAFTKTTPLYDANPVIGYIDGEAVTFEQLRNKKSHDLSFQLYQQLKVQLLDYTIQKLAKTHKEITLKSSKKPSEKEIESIYVLNNLAERGTLDDLRPQIKQYIMQQVQFEHLNDQYALALKKGWIVSHLEAPSEFVMKSFVKTAFIRGNKTASVIVLEFSDYQCPFCGRVQGTITRLIGKYQDRVAFGYRHFPLAFHKEADEAAIAAECSREQGKFEAMHRLLFLRQKAQTNKDLKRYAREIIIPDPEKYEACLDSEKYRGLVNEDMKDGSELGITGTPGFLIGSYNSESGEINGEIISGAQPFNVFQRTIEKYLSRN